MDRVRYNDNNRISMLKSGDVTKYYDDKGNLRAYVKDGKIRFYTGPCMFSMRLHDKVPGMLYSKECKHGEYINVGTPDEVYIPNQEQVDVEKYIYDTVKEITNDCLKQ